jgi:TRAP transporter TAXI family solute receptor
MKRFVAALVAVIAGIVLAPGVHAQEKTNLSIGTGGTGGVYYPLGGGMANILSKHLPNVRATAEVTGASVDNMRLIGAGRQDFGFTMADTALDASKGVDRFRGQPVPARTLMVLYPNRMHVVTVESTGIRKFADLKGKRVSVGSPGSGTEITALRVLEANNMISEVKRERLSVAESVNALKDRKIDAFFWVGGLPTAAVTDLAATPGTKIVMIDHAEALAEMNRRYDGLYAKDIIPKGTYSGQDRDNQVIAVWNILATNEKMSEKMAYDIVKTLFENKPDLVAVHKEAENIDLKRQIQQYSPIPFHPGAIKYFAEKGVKVK